MSRQAYYGKNLGKYVSKVIKGKQEKKVLDYEESITIDYVGEMIDLSNLWDVAILNNMVGRIGDSIDISSLLVKGILFMNPVIVDEMKPNPLNATVRLIVFQWEDHPYFNTPLVGAIIEDYVRSGTNIVQQTTFTSHYNKENAGKFHVMHDHMYTLSLNGTSSIVLDWTFTDMPIKTIPYDLTSQGGGNVWNTTGSIYMIAITDLDSDLFQPVELYFSKRLVFTDS